MSTTPTNTTGLVVGKFYPPHAGHHYLIDEATKRCDTLYVLVASSTEESIPLWMRADWLQTRHPNVVVLWTEDNYTHDLASEEMWQAHTQVFREALGARQPDVLFSSEAYGPELARRLEARHEFIDPNRAIFPVSGTALREDPITYWRFLGPEVRAYLTKRVVICGAESTGTTTLAHDLAEHYNTAWVPEFGRTFSKAVGPNYLWQTEDFDYIADTQEAMEDALARRAGPVLICDTDAYATQAFHELYLDFRSPTLDARPKRDADLYIVTDHGIPFYQDGYRYNENDRGWMTAWFGENLPQPHLVAGDPEARVRRASQWIDALMTWDFVAPKIA